jgi:hypothetical protein
VAGDCFFTDLLEILDTFFCCGNGRFREGGGNSSGFIAHHEVKRGCIARVVLSVVMNELCHRKVIGPFSGCGAAIDAKIGFKFLIEAFGLSIGLRMIGSRKGYFVIKESSKLFGELRGELWASIRDQLVIKPESQEYFLEKELSNSFGSDGFLAGREDYPLSKPMVHRDHD